MSRRQAANWHQTESKMHKIKAMALVRCYCTMLLVCLVIACCCPILGAEQPAPPSIKEFLSQHGLACCVEPITRKGGWFQAGGAVDAVSDLGYLTDDIISRLPLPRVKKNILEALASQARDEASKAKEATRLELTDQRRREAWTRNWVEYVLAALETMLRGFMLGFGMSFIYETLILNQDFYTAVEDLKPRVLRAAFRAVALGSAVAVTLHGASMLVPFALRSRWVADRP